MIATRSWACDVCGRVINSGAKFEIINGAFKCHDCVTGLGVGRQLLDADTVSVHHPTAWTGR